MMQKIQSSFSLKMLSAVVTVPFLFAVTCLAQIKPKPGVTVPTVTVIHIKGHTFLDDNAGPFTKTQVATFEKTVNWKLDYYFNPGLKFIGSSYGITNGASIGFQPNIPATDFTALDETNKTATGVQIKLTSLTLSAEITPRLALRAYFPLNNSPADSAQSFDAFCAGKWGSTITLPLKIGSVTSIIYSHTGYWGEPPNNPHITVVIPATVRVKVECRSQ